VKFYIFIVDFKTYDSIIHIIHRITNHLFYPQ
jgi:hypothetical protein